MKICFSNLVYGDRYTKVFLDYHLRSLVHDSNLSAFTPGCEYHIFTDGKNIEEIKANRSFQKLAEKMPVKFMVFVVQGDAYSQRYSLQSFQTKHSAKFSLENDFMLSMTSADTVYGEAFWVKALHVLKNNNNIDAILTHPMRSGYEGMCKILDASDGVLDADTLFEHCFMNQHPLWMHQNWDTPFFSKMPYHLLWSDHGCIVVRPFSVSPIVFKPVWDIVNVGGNADIYILPFMKNPYYVQDWSEFPCAEIGFLSSWYPSYSPYPASTLRIAQWAKKVILPQNITNLRYPTYFKKRSTPIPHNLLNVSSVVAEEIIATVNAFQ